MPGIGRLFAFGFERAGANGNEVHPFRLPAEKSRVSRSRRTYWSACWMRFFPSIGSGLRTPCSRLLPHDLDALTRP